MKKNVAIYVVSAFQFYNRISDKDNKMLSLPEQRDIEAVERTINILTRQGDKEALNAVKSVYFNTDKRSRREINKRIALYAADKGIARRDMVNILEKATDIFIDERGLRSGDI